MTNTKKQILQRVLSKVLDQALECVRHRVKGQPKDSVKYRAGADIQARVRNQVWLRVLYLVHEQIQRQIREEA